MQYSVRGYREDKMKTFKQIAPKWFRALTIYRRAGAKDYEEYIHKHNLNICRSDVCIVGEAHGFNAKFDQFSGEASWYDCPACHDFGIDFENTFDHDFDHEIMVPTRKTDSVAKKFAQHWNEKHEEKK